jgi:hypothetical protein
METSYVTALAAIGGAALGGLTSYASSRSNLRTQMKVQHRDNSRSRRRELYKEFIDEAAKIYGDALIHDHFDFAGLIGLYSLISKMRVLSSSAVIESATRVARIIAETYNKPNKTPMELETMIADGTIDFLKGFSDACRQEFENESFN